MPKTLFDIIYDAAEKVSKKTDMPIKKRKRKPEPLKKSKKQQMREVDDWMKEN